MVFLSSMGLKLNCKALAFLLERLSKDYKRAGVDNCILSEQNRGCFGVRRAAAETYI